MSARRQMTEDTGATFSKSFLMWGGGPPGAPRLGARILFPTGCPNKQQLTPCLGRSHGGPALLEHWGGSRQS